MLILCNLVVLYVEIHTILEKTFHKSFIRNCPSGGVCFYTFLHIKKVESTVLEILISAFGSPYIGTVMRVSPLVLKLIEKIVFF